jgi:D-3-phosphoglycerate dehydrogenase
VQVATTPGKNAAAVADLTIGLLITTFRNLVPALKDVDLAAAEGRGLAESTFEGARWFGRELSGRTLGLVGLGNVARLVATRAASLGMPVIAYDPFVTGAIEGVEQVHTFGELLERSDAVSIHARATKQNNRLFDAAAFARLPAGAVFVNTARESLVDENALLDALRSGHLGGAALDVCEPDGVWRELVETRNVTLLPHIAGATFETLHRGADMLAEQISAWAQGEQLRWPA